MLVLVPVVGLVEPVWSMILTGLLLMGTWAQMVEVGEEGELGAVPVGVPRVKPQEFTGRVEAVVKLPGVVKVPVTGAMVGVGTMELVVLVRFLLLVLVELVERVTS